jgi:hypothetical protein
MDKTRVTCPELDELWHKALFDSLEAVMTWADGGPITRDEMQAAQALKQTLSDEYFSRCHEYMRTKDRKRIESRNLS